MVFHRPMKPEPPAMPVTFESSNGTSHAFSRGLFDDLSEHVILDSVYAYNSTEAGMFTDQVNTGWSN